MKTHFKYMEDYYNNLPAGGDLSTGQPGIDWSKWYEVGNCMKCGRYTILLESRDGDGAHACKFGCNGQLD